MKATVYESQDPAADPGHRFVALIDYDGFKGARPHLCAFTRAATREEAARKAADFIAATLDKAKRNRTPADVVVLEPTIDHPAAPIAESDFPI